MVTDLPTGTRLLVTDYSRSLFNEFIRIILLFCAYATYPFRKRQFYIIRLVVENQLRC